MKIFFFEQIQLSANYFFRQIKSLQFGFAKYSRNNSAVWKTSNLKNISWNQFDSGKFDFTKFFFVKPTLTWVWIFSLGLTKKFPKMAVIVAVGLTKKSHNVLFFTRCDLTNFLIIFRNRLLTSEQYFGAAFAYNYLFTHLYYIYFQFQSFTH